ncbi:MAGE family-domain-containing protein, partial [Blyttiomyces helicus]
FPFPISRNALPPVLKEHKRAFEPIFRQAQDRLRTVFGMEMVPLPTREKRGIISQAARRNAKQNRKAVPAISNSWVLVNIIPSDERDGMIAWGNERPNLALLCIILSFIYANGRSIADDVLNSYLRPMGLSKGTQNSTFGSIEEALEMFAKYAYIEKIKIPNADADKYEYIWGPRAKVEFTEDNVVEFMTEIYPEMNDTAKGRLAKDIRRQGGQKQVA